MCYITGDLLAADLSFRLPRYLFLPSPSVNSGRRELAVRLGRGGGRHIGLQALPLAQMYSASVRHMLTTSARFGKVCCITKAVEWEEGGRGGGREGWREAGTDVLNGLGIGP